MWQDQIRIVFKSEENTLNLAAKVNDMNQTAYWAKKTLQWMLLSITKAPPKGHSGEKKMTTTDGTKTTNYFLENLFRVSI